MSEKKIYDLPVDVIRKILNYLFKEESLGMDLINLCVAIKPMRNFIKEEYANLYNVIKHDIYDHSEERSIDILKILQTLWNKKQSEKKSFLSDYIAKIKNNKNLIALVLKHEYNEYSYRFEQIELLEQIMSVVKSLHSLKSLKILMEVHTLDDLHGFTKLEHIHLNVKMNADDLVECCKANQNLYSLVYLNNEIYGILSDIVPYCNNLQVLRFRMKENAAEYAPFAKLPKLRFLDICGVHERGTLVHLFKALAVAKRLEYFVLRDAGLDANEAEELSKITTLTRLGLRFLQPENLFFIKELHKLQKLFIFPIWTAYDLEPDWKNDIKMYRYSHYEDGYDEEYSHDEQLNDKKFVLQWQIVGPKTNSPLIMGNIDPKIDLTGPLLRVLRECKQLEYLGVNFNEVGEIFETYSKHAWADGSLRPTIKSLTIIIYKFREISAKRLKYVDKSFMPVYYWQLH